MDSIPRLVVTDLTSGGWKALHILTREEQAGVERFLSIGNCITWTGQRFLPVDSVRIDQDDAITIRAGRHSTVFDWGSVVILQRGIGVTFCYMGEDARLMHSHSWDSLTLMSVSSTRQVAAPVPVCPLTVWPHPVTSTAAIAVELERPAALTVSVFDALGRQLATLSEGFHDAGRHVLQFDASRLPRGMYFIRAIAGSEVRTRKLILQ